MLCAMTLEEFHALIDAASPIIPRLRPQQRQRLTGLIERFLDEVVFTGADGFAVTPKVELTIAAQASLLLVNRSVDSFGVALQIVVHEGPVEGMEQVMGMWSGRGRIDLSWPHVLRGGFIGDDGCNVVMHEFAHVLDGGRHCDGVPAMGAPHSDVIFREIMDEELQRFRAMLEGGAMPPLNSYAATDMAEFFACVTEALFEQPQMLREHFPRVYDQLVRFYGDGLTA